MSPNNSERVLDEISRERLPNDLNLMPGIAAKIQQGNRSMMNSTTKRRFFALVLVVALLIALFSMPGVASALRGLFGYIPGVGPVDQSAPLRVLAAPVSDTRGGYTITIDSAVLDSTRTVLDYHIAGQFPTWDDPMRMPTMCQEAPALRLPDGTTISQPSQVRSLGGGVSQRQDIYAALPADANSAVLVLPCLAELPAGEGPTDWEIPLAFAPAPPEMTVFPVKPPVTPVAPATVPPADPAAAASITEAPPSTDDWQFTLEGVAELDQGYYLQTVLRWEDDPDFQEVEILPEALHLFDASDQEVAVWPADQIPPTVLAENGSLALNLQTMPVLNPGPARLVIDAVGVRSSPFVSFTFDVGSDPQPGQTWDVNKTLDIDGHSLRVVSAEYVQAGPNEPALLMLYLEADSSIRSTIAFDKDHETRGSVGSPNSENVPFRAGWYYANGFPEGTLTIEFTSIVMRKPGPWTLTWMPTATPTPEVTPEVVLPLEPGVCADSPQPGELADLPGAPGGRVVFMDGVNYEMFVANLDGSDRAALGTGLIPALAPDGSRIAYFERDGGIYVRAVGGTESTLISGPIRENVSDIWPRWSPDGEEIAFDRTIDHNSDIYVMNADGTGLSPLLEGPEDQSLLGWAPDGQQIIYRVTTLEDLSIRVFNRATRQSREVTKLPREAPQISISPDATRLVYISAQGIFLQNLDGSAPVVLVANGNDFGNPIWSPDGRWILLAYWDKADNTTTSRALLQPDTCQFLRIEAPLGSLISSWTGE